MRTRRESAFLMCSDPFDGARCNPGARDRGRSGESAAESFLVSRGFEVIARNFRYGRRGEIDLIVSAGDLLVFVEVKARGGDRFGGALYSISGRKIETMRKTALYFLSMNPEWLDSSKTCRFDLVAIQDGEILWEKDIAR